MKKASFTLEILGILSTVAGIVFWGGPSFSAYGLPGWVSPGCLLLGAVLLLAAIHLGRKATRLMEADLEETLAHLDRRSALQSETVTRIQQDTRKEMDRFRSDLAHGLRMPIAIVQGYAELLHGDLVANPAVQKEYLRKILQRTRYMSEVLSKQFSSMDAGDDRTPSFRPIDLLALVNQVVDDMKNAASDHGVVIQVVSPEAQVPMDADACQLNRVFFNLLENSIKYMGRDGIVTIRVTCQEDTVSIMVKDDGLGLPSEETEKIFEMEYQGSNHTNGSGSGHGLYWVRSTVEAHGGTVSAESTPGRGMGIFITLPLHSAAAERT